MKSLRNPGWWGVALSVVAIAVTVALYYDARPTRALRVEVLSNSPVVSINTAMGDDMQVLYKGVRVQSLSLILLRIANTGTEPILESEFSEPIRVTLSPGAAVGEASVQESQPNAIALNPTIGANLNEVVLAKVLLNPGDQAVVRILALNNDSTLEVTARVVGVRALEIQSVLHRESNPNRGVLILLAVVVGLITVFSVGSAIWQSRVVVRWRIERLGFNPARHYYTAAQAGIITLPAAGDATKASAGLTSVIRNLDRAFSWDAEYVQRAASDPLFKELAGYERFKDILTKHREGE